MELHALGEFGLIDLIQLPNPNPETVLVGIGDDCAVLPYNDTQYQLASCDLLVEDIHFIRNNIMPYQLGYKAVAVNLSDVAAMGGTPSHILLSVALPPDYTIAEWQELYRGIGDICNRYGVNLIGGDTTASADKLVINVTVIGLVAQENLHLRKDAKPGDAVFVTGMLGGSRAGLELILQSDIAVDDDIRASLMQCHYMPEPCCEEIAVLNRIAGEKLHALNDISDGLVSECYEIADASDCAMALHADAIPVNDAAKRLAEQLGVDGLQWALTGGEDYQLLGTMDGACAEELCERYTAETGKPIRIIGYVTEGREIFLKRGQETHLLSKNGYNHFSNTAQNQLQQPANAIEDRVEQVLLSQVTRMHRALEAQAEYRHDLQNHLACVLGLLESGNTKEAYRYLSQLSDAVPKQDVQYHTRTVLNSLLNQKAAMAKAKQIEYQFHCSRDEDLLSEVSDYDLCTMVGNLLDNGIEHAGGADPYLYVDLYVDDAGNTVLRMENSCDTPPVLQDGIFVSCKAEPASHGKGMKLIQRVLERYHGVFTWQFDADAERFVTQCVFENT